jgi:alkylation response protein AidB-like acyl-CoA dehydrogenase
MTAETPDEGIRRLSARLAELAPLEGTAPHLPHAWRLLHDHGVATGAPPPPMTARAATAAVDLLVAIGSADLSLGRILEGHINARRLVGAYGTDAQNRRVARIVETGGALGVWGADDTTPVTLEADRLSGTKRYCSGLGVVQLAIVPVRLGETQQLVLASTADPDRADPASWAMHGMRATHSGRYRFDGMPITDADRLGHPGDYTREPLFLGGAWRIAAVELGGAFGLLEAARESLSRRGRLDNPIQASRLGDVLIAAHAARALTIAAARHAEGDAARHAPDQAAHHAIAARLAAERVAEEAMQAAPRSVGLEGLATGSTLERRLRDLATYIRQAAPDALKLRVSTALLNNPAPLAGAFDAR